MIWSWNMLSFIFCFLEPGIQEFTSFVRVYFMTYILFTEDRKLLPEETKPTLNIK